MSNSEQTANVILRDDDLISMQVIPADRLITLVWRGYAPSDAYRSILNEALGNVKGLELIRWLADLREMDAILKQDEHWTTEEWFPKLAQTGLKRMAILTSSDYFNQMSVDRIMTSGTAGFPLDVAYFDDPENARSWLLSTKQANEPADR